MKYVMNRHFEKVVNEYVDITDRDTREFIFSINEDTQNKVLMSLTSKLYDHITKRVTSIDFGSIPNSKGDITKIEGYMNLIDCVNTLKNILTEYRQNTEPVDEILQAIDNLKARREKFELGFKLGVELPVMLYSTMTLAVISSTSLLITSVIEYIKVPNSDDFTISLNKAALNKTRNNLLFQNLKKFNISCKKGDVDSVLSSFITKPRSNFVGDPLTFMSIVVVSTLALNILPLLRELIYFFYYSRVRISDYLEIQADLLQMNIYNLERSDDIDKDKKTNIIKKQSKIVSVFKTVANAIAISNNKAERSTKTDVDMESKKISMNSSDFASDSPLF